MMGISLFGTCTMKYNPRLNELVTARPWLAELHPDQDPDTLQGVLEIIHGLDEILCELSGMSRFVFQPGGGADAAYTHACVTRAYHQHRGELDRRDEVITTIQAHPCNAATAAAAGFKVDHAATRGGGVSLRRRARGSGLRPHRRADGEQPGRHGDLQPEHQALGGDRPRGGRAGVLRPRQFQWRHGSAARPRARLRRLHVHVAQDVWRPKGRRRAGGRRLRVLRCIGAVPTASPRAPRWRPLPDRARGTSQHRPRTRVLGERAAGRQGLFVGACARRRRDPPGGRPVGARQ